MYHYQNMHYIFCLYKILLLSVTLLECSEKRNFPEYFLNKKNEIPTEKKLKRQFNYITTDSARKIEYVFHENTFSKPKNDSKFYILQTITSYPDKPGFTTKTKKVKKIQETQKNTIPFLNFSDINTKESYQEKVSELPHTKKTKVCIQCDYCDKQEINLMWLAVYNIVAHRKTEHSICECNKPHPTPKDAYSCTDCQ